MHKRSGTIFWMTVIAVVVLSGSTVGTLLAGAQAGQPPGAAAETGAVPTQVFPSGTIPIKKVIYIWTEVNGATQYQVQVDQGAVRKVNGIYNSTVCSSGTCSVKPANLLSNGSYIWRVRAIINGVYQPYSAWQSFEVKVPFQGFYSSFTSDALDWIIHKGIWSLESSNYFVTGGVAGKASTISHTGEYSTLTYQARMKRDGCGGCVNVLAIHGNPTLDSTGWWKTEYTFDYTNSGLFSVWRDNNGAYTALKSWTSTTAINQGGWNTLMVTADGGHLKFYINGVLVWYGIDYTYPSGAVGIGMYRSLSSSGDKLWVDWAELTPSVGVGTAEIPDPGIEVDGGSRNMSP